MISYDQPNAYHTNSYPVSWFDPGVIVIYRYAGHDASAEYNEVHSPSLIKKSLETKYHIGNLATPLVTGEELREAPPTTPSPHSFSNASPPITVSTGHSSMPGRPALDAIINLDDFEQVASRTLSAKAWAFISGAANDNITRDANRTFLQRIWLRPAVMRGVGSVTTRTRLFGCSISAPIYIAPTGAARTAGSEGELALARAAAATGIVQCFSTPSSYPHDEILEVTPKHAFFQLYVDKEREKSAEAVRRVLASGKVKAIFVTADLPVMSKREADERVKASEADRAKAFRTSSSVGIQRDKKGAGLARQLSSFIDPTLSWEDISWLRSIAGNVPIVIKGVQRAADAEIALRIGCNGIVVSNHGGRAADTAPPAILTLLELHKVCPQVFGAMEVLVDGGFRRGSDVVKAICLGASAVGIGRPFLYALGYGQEGVEHAIESTSDSFPSFLFYLFFSLYPYSLALRGRGIHKFQSYRLTDSICAVLKDEIETATALCGMTDLMRDASPKYVNTTDLDHLVPSRDHPYARKADNTVKSRL